MKRCMAGSPLLFAALVLGGCGDKASSAPGADSGAGLIATAQAAPPPSVALDPAAGDEVGWTYEAYLSPL